MSQVTDFVTPGTPLTMTGLKAFLDACYGAIISGNSGATAPANPVVGMPWIDTSGGATAYVFKVYAAGGWVSIMTFNSTAGTITGLSALLDEDNMASDSAVLPPSQQSVKAYVDIAGSLNRGATPPQNPLEGMLWWDTSGGATAEVLKRYTVTAGWVPIMTLNITSGTITQLHGILDEDDMVSDSAVLPPSQQSVKAYVDNKANSEVGDIRFSLSPTPKANEVKLNGGTLNRGDYPELWAWAEANSLTIADASWAANCGLFSTGDLSTTFRVPDFRAMFPRVIDDGRGVDSGRVHGSYEADDYKAHAHYMVTSSDGTGGVISREFSGGGPTATTTSPETGGAETRPKNVTVYAFICFE